MLQIISYIKESTIPNAGYGVFTAQDIKKDDIVWKFNEKTVKILTESDIESINNGEIKKTILTYSYKIDNIYYYDLTDGKFINHSDNPNLIEVNSVLNEIDIKPEIPFKYSIAARDIKKDEELFVKYFWHYEEILSSDH
jgi:SET domain-containing protein